ncbi:MAG: hypothetical protein AB8H79_00950 [Myxococcota bacterium]
MSRPDLVSLWHAVSLGELGRQGWVCVENMKSQEYKLLGQISANMSADESD